MYKRRKRAKYTWFPTYSTFASGSPRQSTNFNVDTLFFSASIEVGLSIHPVVLDIPPEPAAITPDQNYGEIVALVSQEYVIKRIVGKIYAACEQLDATPASFGGVLTAGLFVARAAENGLQPIGSVAAVPADENTVVSYDPQSPGTIREPWIWRRTWLLGNTAKADTSGGTLAQFLPWCPATNFGLVGGGNMDGPHVDAKTGRRIGNDDRLWIAFSWRPLITTDLSSTALGVQLMWDLRVLGALRRARNRSTF